MAARTGARLYWSERGAIACAEDAPYRGSDTWVWERWRAMRQQEMASYTSETGKAPSCECCGVEAGTIMEGTEMTKPKKTANTKSTKRTTPKSKPAAAEVSPRSDRSEASSGSGAGEDLMVFAFRLSKSLSARFHEKAGAGKASMVARELVEQYVNQPAGEAS